MESECSDDSYEDGIGDEGTLEAIQTFISQ